jgi:hypothetical protein
VAADVSANEPADVTKPDVSPVDRPTLPGPAPVRPHRARFGLIYAALALTLAAAIAGVVVYAGQTIHPGPAWSAWKPSGGGIGAAKQIVAHVAPRYRLPDGNQLLDVITKHPSVSSGGQTVPVPLIAVRGPKGKVDQVEDVSNDSSLTFALCGLGAACSIATGTPSVERAALVRREALELALYTFKYIPGIKSVVAFMPPPAGTKPTTAVYLQKSDLAPELKVPLTRTLSPHVPLPTKISAAEQARVDSITGSKLYTFGYSQTQQGDLVLVLSPPKA